MYRDENFWRQFGRILLRNYKLFLFGGVAVIFELLLSPILASYYSEVDFFKAYLEQNFYQTYQETAKFLNGELYIEMDETRGWRNRPNAISGNIFFDQYGSRSHGGISATSKKTRIIFAGDSRILGGNAVSNSETMNALLENEEIETLNFASPDYSLDQSFLTMQEAVNQFSPDGIVIGIGSNPGRMLDCHFLPFYDLSILPRLKPCYEYEENELKLRIPPYRKLLENFPDNPELLDYLSKYDGLYFRFANFKREKLWKLTPFLACFSKLRSAVSSCFEKEQKIYNNQKLLESLIEKTRNYAVQNNITLIYVLFARRSEVEGNSIYYERTEKILRANSIYFVDTQLLFHQYPGEVIELYADELHCTAQGNQIMALILRNMLEKLESQSDN